MSETLVVNPGRGSTDAGAGGATTTIDGFELVIRPQAGYVVTETTLLPTSQQ